MAAALKHLTAVDDTASAAFLSHGRRPSVIRIRRNQRSTEDARGYLCIFADDGLYVAKHHFESIDELTAFLKPGPVDDVTYAQAVTSILKCFSAARD